MAYVFQVFVTEGDGFTTVYTGPSAIVFAIVGGVMKPVLIAILDVKKQKYMYFGGKTQ